MTYIVLPGGTTKVGPYSDHESALADLDRWGVSYPVQLYDGRSVLVTYYVAPEVTA